MLQERITQDLKEAMKAKNEVKTSILRMAQAALKNKKIELMHELTHDEVIKVIQSLVKQYKDSVSDFLRGGRADLVEKIKGEISILETYLPAALSEEVVRKAVEETMGKLGARGPQDFGKVMGATMKALGSGANGDVVSRMVKEALANKE